MREYVFILFYALSLRMRQKIDDVNFHVVFVVGGVCVCVLRDEMKTEIPTFFGLLDARLPLPLSLSSN